ncbi:unnamed protein product [Auanema sp. JU1783]|nr:unnamed protein product [Auanema sp. JU1783]
MEELIDMMSESKVDPSSLGDHPKFSKFKNAGKAAEQQASRRQERIERQKQSRHDHLCFLRNLDPNEELSDEEQEDQTETNRYGDKRYAYRLMLSEWLVDIPDSLSTEWLMIPVPNGKRVLIICVKNVTYLYNKKGRLLTQFRSALPCRGGLTVIDGIWDDKNIYCLDLLSWDGQVFTDSPFDLRRFWINSKLQENPSLTKGKKHNFLELPQCSCAKQNMEEMVKDVEEKYKLDGFLFYYSKVFYEEGQNPLIGWLKPWMLTELLGVSVPEKWQNTEYNTSGDFIKAFNTKYGHVSKIEKGMDVSS